MAAIKVLLVRGGGYHRFNPCAQILKQTYEHGGLAKCTLAERDTAFDQDLSGYDAVVLYTQGGTLTKSQERNLCRFVKAGGGLVGFHCASDSYVDNPEFMKMIGTHFVTHAPGTLIAAPERSGVSRPLVDSGLCASVGDSVAAETVITTARLTTSTRLNELLSFI